MKTKFIVVDSCGSENLKSITRFAKKNGVDTILDVGGLCGHIDDYAGLRVFATYWNVSKIDISKGDFSREVHNIGGTVVRNGSIVEIDGMWFLMRCNLIGHNSKMSNKIVRRVVKQLGDESLLQKYALFGDTGLPYLIVKGYVVFINPGAAKDGLFVVLDTATNEIEFRTVDRIIFRYNGPSSVIGIRGLDGLFLHGAYVLLLENGMEQLYFRGRVSDPCEKVIALVHHVQDGKVVFTKYRVMNKGVDKTFNLTE